VTVEHGAWVAETRHRLAGWDLPAGTLGPSTPPHLPWVQVALTDCPGTPWVPEAHGPALVCRHKHYHPVDGPRQAWRSA
jgi:hypothetical protein